MATEEENSEEDNEENEEENDEGGESNEEENDPAAGLKSALDKERKERKRLAKEIADLKKGQEKDDEKAVREAEERVAEKYKGIVVRSEAKAAFVEAGLKGSPAKLIKLIDLDEVEVDDDGDVVGLEDQIKQIKKEFPELFEGKKLNAPGNKDTGGTKKPTGTSEKKSSAQRIFDQWQEMDS